MFLSIKGFKKEDLKTVVEEIGETVPTTATISELKNVILSSKEYESDPEFVKEILLTTVSERKLQLERQESERKLQLERREKFELEKLRLNHELELARIEAQNRSEVSNYGSEAVGSRKKFTLPKLEFRQFGDNLKDWLPFWSQFEHIHKDDDIAPENKFQYLIQATVVGSRAREVVESFPPTGANYAKAVESLKTRFGREDLLVEVYVRELLKLIISVQSKERLTLTSLYDKLESYLRALETLGVTTDKCASILYPMVESCFSEDFLKVWNRSSSSSTAKDARERLDKLMIFLRTEVEGEERISLAMEGFGLGKNEGATAVRRKYSGEKSKERIPTASALLSSTRTFEPSKSGCIFCEGKHSSADCFKAMEMTLKDRRRIVREKRCCYACLGPKHTAKRCRAVLKCVICGRKHVPLLCDTLENRNSNQNKEEEVSPSEITLSNVSTNPKVFLQTLKAKLLSDSEERDVRILLDTGSQKSYILKGLAKEMKYSIIRKENVKHSLFGGVSEEYQHNCHRVKLRNLNGKFTCNFEVFDQHTICGNVNPVCKGPWLKELRDRGIRLTDVSDDPKPVQILIGADIVGRLLTGRRKVLSSGLVAIETYLGWTLMGKVAEMDTPKENLAMTVTTLFVKGAGSIRDPVEKESKLERELRIKDIKEWSTPDIDAVDHRSFNKRVRYRQKLQQDLRRRFRSEYLGLLVRKANSRKDSRKVNIGDVVMVGADKSKRIDWPLGRIIGLIPGRDGNVRLVRIQTSHSKLLRPIQRVYPLEISSDRDPPVTRVLDPREESARVDSKHEGLRSRYGRNLRMPNRFVP